VKQECLSDARRKRQDCADCMSSGRVFQEMEAATGNGRRLAVDRRRRYCGMYSCSVNDDRRRRRPGRLDTKALRTIRFTNVFEELLSETENA